MNDERLEELHTRAAALPDEPGVYVFKDADGAEMYVGKARSLKKRVRSYFERVSEHDAKTAALVESIHDLEVLVTASEVEALLLENRFIKELQPRFNVALRDSKDFPYLAITWSEDFPRVYVTRDDPVAGNRYYGPFTSAGELRAAVRLLQKVFRVRGCKLKISAEGKEARYRRPCLNYYIGRCSAPCAGRIDRRTYRENVRRFSAFIAGKRKRVLAELNRKMRAAAAARNFEDAAFYRDQINALDALRRRGSLNDLHQPLVAPIDLTEGLAGLAAALGLASPPRLIEGMDVSNLGPAEIVGAVVTFADGIPQRGGYRRFRIKTVAGQDDVAGVSEIAQRRYSRMLREAGLPAAPAAQAGVLPDIVLVDGGKGHLRAVHTELHKLGIHGVEVLALAKEEESVWWAKTMQPLELPARSPAKRLLQYVRDEAHRFAQHYHHILRRKFVLGEETDKK